MSTMITPRSPQQDGAARLHIESFEVGPLACNCSIIADLDAKQAIVVDPGGNLPLIRDRLHALGVRVASIIHTHTHIDHVGATAGLQRETGARACIHEKDRFLYDMLPVQAAMLGIAMPEKTEMEGSLNDGHVLRAGALEVAVLHTPGHTPGSVSFLVNGPDRSHVFTGDTLFNGGIGRTDLWGGDFNLIKSSIRERLLTLPDDAVVVCGHGPDTTIGAEKRHNPFIRSFGL